MINKMKTNVKTIIAVLFVINILNFLDRGIIPGASEEFNQFITDSGITSQQDAYLGLLQSAFIIGYAIASVIFGHLVHFYSPFYLCIIGLFVWIVAIIFSGLSYYSSSYAFLFIARMVSGVGEAAFQITIPPWISKYAPAGEKGTYLSLFFTAIPTGTALGYIYSASIATSIGWQYAFFLEAVMMSVFIPFLFYIAPEYPVEHEHDNEPLLLEPQSPGSVHVSASKNLYVISRPEVDVTSDCSNNFKGFSPTSTNADHGSVEKPTVKEELLALLGSPIYLCIVAGYAAQTGTVIGLSTFGSSFLIGLGYFDTETQSSAAFGVIVSLAGAVSTPLGGALSDWLAARSKASIESKNNLTLSKALSELVELQSALVVITVMNIIGATLLSLAYLLHPRGLFLTDLFFGVFFIFLSSASINLAVMLSVPERHRSMAMGLSCLGLHLFGDVPSPIITGLLKSSFAPSCSGSIDEITPSSASSDACRSEGNGLRLTMLLVSLWLFVCVLFMWLAWVLSSRLWSRRSYLELGQMLLNSAEEDYDGKGPSAGAAFDYYSPAGSSVPYSPLIGTPSSLMSDADGATGVRWDTSSSSTSPLRIGRPWDSGTKGTNRGSNTVDHDNVRSASMSTARSDARTESFTVSNVGRHLSSYLHESSFLYRAADEPRGSSDDDDLDVEVVLTTRRTQSEVKGGTAGQVVFI